MKYTREQLEAMTDETLEKITMKLTGSYLTPYSCAKDSYLLQEIAMFENDKNYVLNLRNVIYGLNVKSFSFVTTDITIELFKAKPRERTIAAILTLQDGVE